MKAAFVFPLALCLSALIAVDVVALPNGPPETICNDAMLRPTGHAVTAFETSPSPYQLDVLPSQGEVVVTISGGGPFKGYAIQGQNSEKFPVGSFEESPKHKYRDCGDVTRSTVTHNSPGPHNRVEVKWIAPENFSGQVTFRATVLQSMNKFWTLKKTVSVVNGVAQN